MTMAMLSMGMSQVDVFCILIFPHLTSITFPHSRNFILYNYQNGRAVAVGTSYSGVFNVSSPPMYFDGTYIAPADSAPLTILNPKFGSPVGVAIMVIAGLSIVFSVITMVIVVLYRHAQVIKASR